MALAMADESVATTVRSLRWPVLALLVGALAHEAARLSGAAQAPVLFAGAVQLALVVITLVVVRRGRPRAPELAAVVALAAVIGAGWAWTTGGSWFASVGAAAELATAIACALVAVRVVRARRWAVGF